MRRVHFVECEDCSRLPQILRNGITDYLSFMLRLGKFYDPVIPLLDTALGQMGETEILDCCSGAGGPWLHLYEKVVHLCPGVRLRLSDYFPN